MFRDSFGVSCRRVTRDRKFPFVLSSLSPIRRDRFWFGSGLDFVKSDGFFVLRGTHPRKLPWPSFLLDRRGSGSGFIVRLSFLLSFKQGRFMFCSVSFR